jgi:hypothetical protein
MERHPPLTGLDHASMEAAVRASFRGLYGREPTGVPGSGVDDVNYWIAVSDHYGEFSDHVERAGWSRYWEVKLSGRDSADPALGDVPARFQPGTPTLMPTFPAPGRQIIQALYNANRELAAGTTEQQQLLTRLIAEQFAFEFGPQWGCKAAGPFRPQGPSELAFNAPPLYIWRWSDGDGHVTSVPGAPLPEPLLEPLDQTAGQVFLPVDPIDHLQVSDTRPPPRPDLPPAPVDLSPILARLDLLDQRIAMLSDHVVSVDRMADEALHRPLPRYVCKYGPFTLVSKPEGS